MKNMYFITALSLFVLAGCSYNEAGSPDVSGVKAEIWATMNDSQSQTRAYGKTWEDGDYIGVTVGSTNEVRSTNIKYQYAGTENSPFIPAEANTDIYVRASAEVPATAYYPYNGENGTAPGILDISTETAYQVPEEQSKIDYMFAKTTTSISNPQINLAFEHMMSQVVFELNATDNETTISNLAFKLEGVATTGTFDTATGTVSPKEEKGEISTPELSGVTTASLILVPQTTTGVNIEILLNNVYYLAKVETLTLEPKYKYTYTIALDNTEEVPTLSFTGVTITDWTNSNPIEITAEKSIPEIKPITVNDAPTWGTGEEQSTEAAKKQETTASDKTEI